MEVSVPPGVDEGSTLRVPGQGDISGPGSAPGDLFVRINVKPHPVLKRDGSDLILEREVSFVDAILGCSVKVPSVYGGEEELKVPAGTQPGAVIRLKGRGMPSLDSRRKGDLLVKIRVKLPEKVNDRQRQLLQEFEKEGGRNGLFGIKL